MNRRGLLAFSGALAIVAAGCTGGSGDKAGGGSDPVVLTMASRYHAIEWAPAAAYFVKRAGQISGGALRINVANEWGRDGDSGLEAGIVRDVAADKVDLAWVGTGVFDTLGIKSFQALTAPMLIDNYPLEQAVIASDLPGPMLASLDQLGVSGLAVLGDSLRKPIATKAPILGPADWSGIVFATLRSNAQAEAIQALGAQSTNMIGSPLDRGLEGGTIQGRDLGLYAYVGAQQMEGIPYVTANVNLWPHMLVLLANPDVLSTLTEQQRGWLQEAAQEAAEHSTSLVEHDADTAAIACGGGARFANASEADLAWLRETFAPVYRDLEQDSQTKSFIQAIEELKGSIPPGPALPIPSGCTGSAPHGAANDPLAGTWQTGDLTEAEIVRAFVAAGGSEKEGHQFFSDQAANSLTVTLQFQDGLFTEFESADGSSPEVGYKARYEIGVDGTLTMTGCPEIQIFRFDVTGDTLRLHAVKQCTNDGPYNTTLFASFPLTRTE
jgi:TRAP-type C4-dicarboxylate transport system substrate-binding protein